MEVKVRAAKRVRAVPGRGGLAQWERKPVVAVWRSREVGSGKAVEHHWRNCARADE